MSKLSSWCDKNPDKLISHCYDRCKNIVKIADVIILQFSGGKDSGLLSEMILDAHKEYNSRAKLIFSFTHCEWFYTESLNYINRFLQRNKHLFYEIYYKCLPLEWGNGIKTFQKLISWEPGKEWVQEILKESYVIKDLVKAPWVHYGMHEKEEQKAFSDYLSNKYFGQKIYQMVGIRQDESPERRTILYHANDETGEYGKIKNIHICSPIKDLNVKDLWRIYSYCDWDYNKIYDLMYEANVPLNKQRIASLLNSYAIGNLYMLKMIEPELFLRVNSRFNEIEMYTSRMRGFFQIEKPGPVSWNGANHIHPDTTEKQCDFYEQELIKRGKNYERNGMIFKFDKNIEEIKINTSWRDYALHLLNSSMGELKGTWENALITEIQKIKWQAVPVGPSTIEAIKILEELGLLYEKTGVSEYKLFQKHPKSNMVLLCCDTIPYQTFTKEIIDLYKNTEVLQNSRIWRKLADEWQVEIKSCREKRLNEKGFVPKSSNYNENVKLGCLTYFREDIKSIVSWKRLACAILKNDLRYFSI